MRLQTFVGLALVIVGLCDADVFSSFTREATDIINGASMPGVTIRQCTCEEQSTCVEEMKGQALQCVESCWSRFSAITKKPEELRNCFHKTDATLESALTCFEHNVDSCLEKRADTAQIQKVDIGKLFDLSVQKIIKTKEKLTKTLSAPIRRIIDTVGEFGLCVKECFVGKQTGGFCFDKKDCQPLIVDKKARSSLKTCTKLIDFKKEAGELCECSVKAGLTDLSQYCPMLKLIGQSSSSRRRGGGSGGAAAAANNATLNGLLAG